MMYAIEMNDGSVAIMQTNGEALPEDCIAKWQDGERAKVVAITAIEAQAIPEDRLFRNAWTLSNGKIEHDTEKARDIKRDMLRAERSPLLESLDAEQMKLLAAGDKEAALVIEAKKQKLRDITQSEELLAANTIEDIMAVKADKSSRAPT